MLKLIEEHEIDALLDRAACLEAVRAAYRAVGTHGATVSTPPALYMQGDPARSMKFKLKGAVDDALDLAAVRLIANPPDSGGTKRGYIYLARASSGEPLALISELTLFRVRTASTALVACEALAAQAPERFALVGTGRIAHQIVRSIHLVFPNAQVVVGSRDAARAQAAVRQWQTDTPNALRAAGSIREAVRDAQVVVSITNARGTLFRADDLADGALACVMGGQHEIEADVLDAATQFFVDEIEFVCSVGSAHHWIETGQRSRAQIEARVDATIGQVLAGAFQPRHAGRTLALIQGMATCDPAVAHTVYARAMQQA